MPERDPAAPPTRADPGGSGTSDDRSTAADRRDSAADDRDRAGDERDGVADERDLVGDVRDEVADERDHRADERDRVAEGLEGSGANRASEASAVARAGRARQEAASDRSRALDDRRAGAGARASGRVDRRGSRADRGAAAVDRVAASIDELTGTYVRGAGLAEMQREADRAKRTGRPLLVAFVDVDQLKAVNDSEGHLAGDIVLVKVAETLRAELRSYDLIVRYGGDEFLCGIGGLGVFEGRARLDGVNRALRSQGSRAAVSFGLAVLEGDEELGDAIRRADTALYSARDRRRDPGS